VHADPGFAANWTTDSQQDDEAMTDTLMFVDTNILLDLYRLPKQSLREFLAALENASPHLIMNFHVEMEFKKNRQKVILSLFEDAGLSAELETAVPPVLETEELRETVDSQLDELVALDRHLKREALQMLEAPSDHDPVYQCLNRLFHDPSPNHLSRSDDSFEKLLARARRRFSLSWPPRRRFNDSVGDCIHWEWILECAARSSSQVIVATRDRDFGATFEGHSFLDDWMREEFTERVGNGCRASMTPRLADGLEAVGARVSPEMQQAEERILGNPFARGEVNGH